jgi:glutamine synthetase
MKSLRLLALKESLKRKPKEPISVTSLHSEFNKYVFTKAQMQRYLSIDTYNELMQAIEKGERISRKIADQVALGMKTWAIEHGATHYTHWFQPLNEASAEKHDTFFEIEANGTVIEKFSGDKLVQQEPDASSFPSGGMRSTFEARGYTAWDPSSPAFILGKTLCIPSIFISYNGDALDFKLPLLRSLSAIDKAATEICKLFYKNVNKVIVTFGWEQEYFLVDEALFMSRPDLTLTGRTLVGHASAKDQQLEDHYFASIPERVKAFMQDLEIEAWRLGIPLKTRHNEVSPNQFECASTFEDANLANDHNMLLMDIMRKIAERHNFKVLLHEKPFAGINGSGKHSNWSLMTSNGINLLSPGNNELSNLRFLSFLSIIIKAVYDYNDLIKASIMSLANEYRLGGNEAPPNIISIFIGNTLSKVFEEIENKISKNNLTIAEKKELQFDIEKIPEILVDNTDRNRTSPFAFTGNRFEFRAVGASANAAAALIAINTAVAKTMHEFSDNVNYFLNKGLDKETAILKTIQKFYTSSKDILFDGNGYSKEWYEEAKKRNLSVTSSAVEGLKAYIKPKNIELLEKLGILKKHEIEARYEVCLEYYIKKLQIEARVLSNLVDNHILPAALKYQQQLIDIIYKYNHIFSETNSLSTHKELLQQLNTHITELHKLKNEMDKTRSNIDKLEDIKEKANLYSNEIKPFLEKIRYHADKIELLVDNEDWPLAKYRELLFIR